MSGVVIIDSGGANIASLQAALGRLGTDSRVTTDHDTIRRAPRVLLPGVGSAHDAMARLRIAGLDRLIPQLKQPLLGICLGIIPGSIDKLRSEPGRPVPHMGWNQMTQVRTDPLLEGISSLDHVYFVHSFAAPTSVATVAITDYGTAFTAVVRRDNFCGTQFHPERSGVVGARILANFLKEGI